MTQTAQAMVVPVAIPAAPGRLADFATLAKPRITSLVAATAAGGYYVGATGAITVAGLLNAIAGTALCSAGASALNMVMERDVDAKMERTRSRPLPAGRLGMTEAAIFGSVLCVAGLAWLAFATNWLTVALGAAAILGYVFVYTPSKTRTSLSTPIGAVPGALPPVIGYAASHGALDAGAASLFLILFFWQLPHFLALAWMYREDYAKAGCPLLPVSDPEGGSTARQVILQTAALIVASALPFWFGMAGPGYLAAALVLGAGFLALGAAFCAARTRTRAVRLFLASVIYLPVLFGALALGRASIL